MDILDFVKKDYLLQQAMYETYRNYMVDYKEVDPKDIFTFDEWRSNFGLDE